MSDPSDTTIQGSLIQVHPVTGKPLENDLTIRAGQTDLEVKYTLLGLNRSDPALAAMVYRARLIDHLKRHHDNVSWNEVLTQRQQEVMLEGRRCKERREYAKDKGGAVRSYRRDMNLSAEEKRAEDAARKRQERAATAGPSKLKTDVSAMTDEERDEHRRQKARARQQRKRQKDRLTSGMTPEQLAQHEHDLERAEEAKLLAIIADLRK